MKFVTFKCDECLKLKAETNHWWTVTKGADVHYFTISPMPEKCGEEIITLCGRECVQKMLEKWMAELT